MNADVPFLDERPLEKLLQPPLRLLVEHLLSPLLYLFDFVANTLSDLVRAAVALFFWIPTAGSLGPFTVHDVPFFRSRSGNARHPAVVVTGTSRGMGRDMALTLARKGYVVFATVRKPSDAESLVTEFLGHKQPGASGGSGRSTNGGEIRPVLLELDDEESIKRAAKTVLDAVSENGNLRLAGVVNNAAVITVEPFAVINIEEYRRSISTNLNGTLSFTQKLLPALERDKGRIVNVGSIAAWLLGPCFGQYCASKAALAAQTFVQRIELANVGVAVSLIEPGAFRTSAWDRGVQELVRGLESNGKVGIPGAEAGADTTGKHVVPNKILERVDRTVVRKISYAMRFARMVAFPPGHVTANVIHALTSPFPRPRYLAGFDAKLFSVIIPLIGYTGLEIVLKLLF